MSRNAKLKLARITAAETSLDRLARQLVERPAQPQSLAETIDAMTARLQQLGECSDENATAALTGLRARAFRMHSLLESALAFHCGALLTNPAVVYTYSPAGEMLEGSAVASLSLEA